jgi:hypothetical protein
VEAAGIEPSDDFDATESSICDCENCQQCRAANALDFIDDCAANEPCRQAFPGLNRASVGRPRPIGSAEVNMCVKMRFLASLEADFQRVIARWDVVPPQRQTIILEFIRP